MWSPPLTEGKATGKNKQINKQNVAFEVVGRGMLRVRFRSRRMERCGAPTSPAASLAAGMPQPASLADPLLLVLGYIRRLFAAGRRPGLCWGCSLGAAAGLALWRSAASGWLRRSTSSWGRGATCSTPKSSAPFGAGSHLGECGSSILVPPAPPGPSLVGPRTKSPPLESLVGVLTSLFDFFGCAFSSGSTGLWGTRHRRPCFAGLLFELSSEGGQGERGFFTPAGSEVEGRRIR